MFPQACFRDIISKVWLCQNLVDAWLQLEVLKTGRMACIRLKTNYMENLLFETKAFDRIKSGCFLCRIITRNNANEEA